METQQPKPAYADKYIRLLNELKSDMKSKHRNLYTFDDLIKSIDDLYQKKLLLS